MRGDPIDPERGARPTCYSCFRPQSHCVCGYISPITAHCNVLILQHPNERKKYYSTTKLVTKALKNSRMLRGLVFEESLLSDTLRGQQPYLLFPGSSSVDCQQVTLEPHSTIIVVDGTWSEAGKIVNRNPILKTFPRVSFSTNLQSNYRIRKQPRKGYLSTLESIGYLLQMNARAAGKMQEAEQYSVLFDIFDKMVTQQLQHFPRMRQLSNEQVLLK